MLLFSGLKKKRIKKRVLAKPVKTKANRNTSGFNKELFLEKTLLVLSLLILSVCFFNIYAKIFDEKLHLGGDNAGYYILGNALASGSGYSQIHSFEQKPANHFPPGYPAVISVVINLFSNDISTIKKANGFFLFSALIMLFLFFRLLTKNIALSFAVSLLLLYNFHILQYSTIMMSEIPFLFFSTLAFFLFIKSDLNLHPYRNILFLFFILTLGFCYYLRTAGIAIFGGIFLYLLYLRKWKYLGLMTAGYVVIIIPWHIRSMMLGGNSYIKQLLQKNPYRPELGSMEFADWFTRFFTNVERYITREIPNGIFSFNPVNYKEDITGSEWIIGTVIVLIIGWGMFRLKAHRLAILGYVIGTFGILFLWPDSWFGVRFVLPIVPLLLLFFSNGLYDVVKEGLERIGLKHKMVSIVLPLGLLFAIPEYTPGVERLHNQSKGEYVNKFKNYFELALWAKENTEEEAIICCRKGQLFYLYSHRFVTGYKNTLDKEELVEDLKNKGVDYVVLEQLGYASTGRYLYPAIQRYPAKFQLVKKLEDPETYIMKFNPDLGYWGEWENDMKNGKGTYLWQNGVKYEGNWVNNKREGFGIFTWTNGNRFEGDWKNDKRNGPGILYYPDGRKLTAHWENELLHGEATLTTKDGTVINQMVYKNNVVVKSN